MVSCTRTQSSESKQSPCHWVSAVPKGTMGRWGRLGRRVRRILGNESRVDHVANTRIVGRYCPWNYWTSPPLGRISTTFIMASIPRDLCILGDSQNHVLFHPPFL